MNNTIHKVRWFARHLARNPYWTLRRLAGYFKPPLFVFQMGKVGSVSIANTIETKYHICHFHTSREFDIYTTRYPTESHLASTTGTFDIITATRDPIGREISAFFQNVTNLKHTYGVGTREMVSQMTSGDLIAAFRKVWATSDRLPDTTVWFDRCFRLSTGIDVYAHPFDSARGWSIIHDRQWRVLVLRFEDINRNYLEAINAFVTERFGDGAAFRAMKQANISGEKWYSDIMREFKKSVTFTKAELDSIYDSSYCRHFYSKKEIASMREKWTQEER